MKQVYVLGDGQLGRMLRQAGEPLGITVWLTGDSLPAASPLAASPLAKHLLASASSSTPASSSSTSTTQESAAPAIAIPGMAIDAVTAEIERWADTPLTRHLAQHPAFINRHSLPVIADRLTQKQLLAELTLPAAHWQPLTSPQQWHALFAELGSELVIKRRIGGYDGRGQWRISAHGEGEKSADNLPAECYTTCIAEQAIHFGGEASLIGARNRRGECVFFPLTYNLHQAGILRASIAVTPRVSPQSPGAGAQSASPHSSSPQSASPLASLPFSSLQQQAQQMLSAIMQRLNYVGVMAMECFITPQGLLINELAPRVHNSGHWTQDGASVSQFALHLCAILDLPMPVPHITLPSVMINLIGSEFNEQWLRIPYLHVHWYHKQVRAGRKTGHLNLCAPTPDALHPSLEALIPLLAEDYTPIIRQLQNSLMP